MSRPPLSFPKRAASLLGAVGGGVRQQKMTTTGHQPQPEEVMHQVQAELANAYAQEFFSTVREKCFKMCVSKPSSALSGYERKCLEQCTERYVDATRMISQVVLKQYSQGGGGGGGV